MPTKELYLEVNKRTSPVRMHVLDHTPDGGSPTGTCILLHGFTQTGYSWDPLIEDVDGLLAQGYRAVCVDLRGHGKSGWASDGDYSRASMVSDVIGVADALDIQQFFLLGLSMGGALATALTADNPDRVQALVLVDWAPWPDGVPTSGIKRIGSLFNLRWDSFEDAVEMMHNANPRRSREDVALRMKQQLRKADDGWRWGTDPAFAVHGGLRAKESPDVMWRTVESVRCPALMVRGGESDVVPPAQAELMAKRLQKGQLAVVDGAGHSVIGDKPAASKEAIVTFLNSLAGGKAKL